MTNDEEIVFEKAYQAYNMTLEERNFYLSLLSHTKEVESSTRVVDPSRPLSSYEPISSSSDLPMIFIDEDETTPLFSTFKKLNENNEKVESPKGKPFDMVTMALQKDPNGNVIFNGAISNLIENKWIDGVIEQKGPQTFYITTNVYRFYEHLRESERMYSARDTLVLFDDKMVRETRYSDNIRYEKYFEVLPPLTEEKQQEYIMSLARKLK